MDNNEELKNQILQDFKVLNNIITKTPDEENPEETQEPNYDNIFKLYIDKAIQEILNLTNRLYFPIELKYVVLDMINDFYTINQSKFANGGTTVEASSGVDDSYIKSISEAGRSVTFASTSELVLNSLLSSHITTELDNRQKQIYRYRLLYKEMPRKEDIVEKD